MKQLAFYVNMEVCYGCQTCEVACKSQNCLPAGVRWRRVRFFDEEQPASRMTLSLGCNHCADPQCLKNCPVAAYTKRDDGLVIQDHEACIGCRMCMMACPYGVPQYDPEEGKVSKCDGCARRLEQGLAPRCVESCPGHALDFGELSELQAKYPGARLLNWGVPSGMTGPSVLVTLPARRR